MVKADLGTYIVLALIFTAINSVGSIITQGPLMVGFHIFCMKKMMNRKAEFGDLFKGFNYFVPAIVASIIIALFTFAGALACLVGSLVVVADLQLHLSFHRGQTHGLLARHAGQPRGREKRLLRIHDVRPGADLVDLLGVLCCVVGVFVAMPVTVAAITVAYKNWSASSRERRTPFDVLAKVSLLAARLRPQWCSRACGASRRRTDHAFELCGFHWLTGRPCPFCGLTRAMFAIAKGHVAQAMHFNALSPLAAVMLLSLFWNGPGGVWRGRLWTVGLAAFAIYGVYRVVLPGS